MSTVGKTLQEVFEISVTGLLKQGERSLDLYGQCFYRLNKQDKTLKCAVGFLIDDDEYKKIMEGLPVEDFCDMFPGIIDYEHESLLGDLQSIHDTSNEYDIVEYWKENFIRIGKKYKLDTDFIKSL